MHSDLHEQAMVSTVIYTIISLTFSAIAGALAVALFKAPLYAIAVPFLGAMLFICLAIASGCAAVYCARRI